MTFTEWIQHMFGDRGVAQAANFLGYPYRTVVSWASLNRFPTPKKQEDIRFKSGNLIDLDKWRSTYLEENEKRKQEAA